MTTFVENSQIVAAIIPVDLTTTANNGDWFDMRAYRRCAVVVFTGIGTAGQDAVITLKQATDASGSGVKALTFTDIYEKEGATALSAIARFTHQTQAAATSYTSATSAENEQLVVIEVADTDLDVANDFTHIQVSIADVGANSQLGAALYIGLEPRYGAVVGSMASAIG